MFVRRLQARSFRNLSDLSVTPGARFNVFSGDNAQGKTNLLEAIYLLGTLRSFRTKRSRELIQSGQKKTRVHADVTRDEVEHQYEVTLSARGKKITLDGKKPSSLHDYFGDFNVILFAPEDLRVPRGAPAGRRRFLDRAVFTRRATFLRDAQQYARVLRSRNAILRRGAATKDLLSAYDPQLVAFGSRVTDARKSYLAALSPHFCEAFANITRTGEQAHLSYLGAEEDLAAALQQSLERDIERRKTHVGPHLHDVEFLIDEKPARAYASQGQLRALVLAWKTAEMRLLMHEGRDAPVLLLDDVSSELDPAKTQTLFDFLTEIRCQCFVTTTHAKHVLVSKNRVDYRVVAGEISPVSVS